MTNRSAVLLLASACLLEACVASTVHAQAAASDDALRWEPRRRVGLPEYAITLSAPVVLRFAGFALGKPEGARLGGGILFDDAVRSALVLDTRAARDDADRFSDISWASSMAYPFADALITAWAVHGNPDVAWQMLVVSAQTMSITALVTELAIHQSARERPGKEECAADPGYTATCTGPSAHHSLPSGHTAGAFAGAGLACAHHLDLPLYGGGAADVIACVAALTWASTDAVARLMADRHWASDVLLGVGLGLGLGWLLPQLVYYSDTGQGGEDRGRTGVLVLPWAAPHSLGVIGAARL